MCTIGSMGSCQPPSLRLMQHLHVYNFKMAKPNTDFHVNASTNVELAERRFYGSDCTHKWKNQIYALYYAVLCGARVCVPYSI